MKIILVLFVLAGIVPAAAADTLPAASGFCFIRQLLPVKAGETRLPVNPLFFDMETGVFSNLLLSAGNVQVPANTSAAGITEDNNNDIAGFLSLMGAVLTLITWPADIRESRAYSQYCQEQFTQYYAEKLVEERLLGRTFLSKWNQ